MIAKENGYTHVAVTVNVHVLSVNFGDYHIALCIDILFENGSALRIFENVTNIIHLIDILTIQSGLTLNVGK